MGMEEAEGQAKDPDGWEQAVFLAQWRSPKAGAVGVCWAADWLGARLGHGRREAVSRAWESGARGVSDMEDAMAESLKLGADMALESGLVVLSSALSAYGGPGRRHVDARIALREDSDVQAKACEAGAAFFAGAPYALMPWSPNFSWDGLMAQWSEAKARCEAEAIEKSVAAGRLGAREGGRL